MILSEHAQRARILVVDDEDVNRRLLDRILRAAGYVDIRALYDARDIETVIDDYDPDLVLLDLHMPHIDGYEVLRQLAPRLSGVSYLPVLILTGDTTAGAKRGVLELGARDFVAKPFDTTEVLLRIRNLLESRFLHRELETRVQNRTHELADSQLEIVERLARAGELRDGATGRHTQRVGQLSALIAEALGAGTRYVELIRRAAPLHDVGKIAIPDNILLKAGKLTAEEREIVRSHTVIGAEILSCGQSELVRMAERIALSHHEKWKGNGYPRKIRGEDIPLEARIVALADFFDALCHPRPYRPAWPVDDVLNEIQRESGSHFDPAVVAAMLDTRCYEPAILPSVLQSKEIMAVNGRPH